MLKFGVFWKIQDICYQMGTEIFKIEEEIMHAFSIPEQVVFEGFPYQSDLNYFK